MNGEPQRLIEDARSLGVVLDAAQAHRLLRLLDELSHWNRSYNLTAITARPAMISAHLLDSLAAQPDLRGSLIADIGTGAGFPGLPLAIAEPQRAFTLIDSVAKKIRFVTHAVRTLGIGNATPVQARVETYVPGQPFDTVVARAYATLADLLERAGVVLTSDASRGGSSLLSHAELAEIPRGWRLEQARQVQVPDLGASVIS